MQKNMLFVLMLIFGWAFTNCTGNQEAQEGAAESEMTEATEATESETAVAWDSLMESYHETMAFTFHPAEDGDLKPLRDEYQNLIQRAEVWANAPLPEDLKGKGLEEKLAKLIEDGKAIGQQVENQATDEELKLAITALHDVFHSIVEVTMKH